jgi:hypothetical protein
MTDLTNWRVRVAYLEFIIRQARPYVEEVEDTNADNLLDMMDFYNAEMMKILEQTEKGDG